MSADLLDAIERLAAYLRPRLWYEPPPLVSWRLDFSSSAVSGLLITCGVL